MPNITKHGDDFYVLDRLHCVGHRDRDGRMLSGPASLVFAFRRPDDQPGVNVEVADVLSVCQMQLGDSTAGELVAAAIEALTEENAAATNDRSRGASPSGGAPAKKAGRKAKEKTRSEAA